MQDQCLHLENDTTISGRADDVLIGNGPEDPMYVESLMLRVRALPTGFPRLIFGICLDIQILARAAGGDTY